MSNISLKNILAILGFITVIAFTTSEAKAQSPILDAWNTGWQIGQTKWESLTPRQKELATRIGTIQTAYTNKTGNRYIPINRQNVLIVMKAIGATPNEGSFVVERMKIYENIAKDLDEVDRVMDSVNRVLQGKAPY